MKCFDIHTHRAQQDILSAALHPWQVTPDNVSTLLADLREKAMLPHVLAIGEAGLDKLHPETYALQLDTFYEVAHIAHVAHKPLIIHCVKAFNDLVAVRRSFQPDNKWIVHGFRGKPALALQLLHHGMALSFGEKFNEETLRIVPLEEMFFETDVSDVPIEMIYGHAATVLDINVEALSSVIKKNVERIFFHANKINP